MKFLKYGMTCTTFLIPQWVSAATLVHEFNFDGSTNDSVGIATGALVGGATISGGTLNLNGIDQYLQVSQNLLPTDGSDFSLAFQARNTRADQNGIQEIISQGVSGGNGFYVGNVNGSIRFSDQFGALLEPTPTDLLYHDFIVTSEIGVGAKFFLDGLEIFSDPTTIMISNAGTATRFGVQFNTGGGFGPPFDEYFQGQIDNVRVFTGALNSEEVFTVFDEILPPPIDPPSIIPLPASGAILLGGLLGLVSLGRRRR